MCATGRCGFESVALRVWNAAVDSMGMIGGVAKQLADWLGSFHAVSRVGAFYFSHFSHCRVWLFRQIAVLSLIAEWGLH